MMDTSKREGWTFTYKVGQVLKGTKVKVAMHNGRVKWWEKQKSAVVKKIKARGMDVKESIAAAYGSTSNMANSGKFAPHAQVVIDPTLQQDLSECVGKINYHKEKEREYGAWADVLIAQEKTGLLSLTQEDWLYFFGK